MREISEVRNRLIQNSGEVMRKYARNPSEFCADIFRVELDDWQSEFMQAVADARAGRLDKTRFAIRSGTGVGKTACVSLLVLWHLACFKDSKIPCTAPTSPQIKAVLWPEIRKWAAAIPDELEDIFPYEVTIDTCKLYDSNFAVARTAQKEKPEAFQGFHSKNIMLIADEASGVPDEIFDAAQGIMSEEGAILIMIGNPTRPFGFFYDAFHEDDYMYWTRRVSCLDSSRVDPKYSEMTKRKYGEKSFQYQVRVLGEFFLEDDDIIIPKSWLTDALERSDDIGIDSDYVVWGFDPSDGGRDAGAVAKRQGNVLLEPVITYPGVTSDRQIDKVEEEYWASSNKPKEIVVDAIGVGTNCFRELKRRLGEYVKITPVYVGVKPTEDRYVSYRVELWGRGRAWAKSSFSVMADDKELIKELSSVVWEICERTGKYRIPDKKVGGQSPNRADAFLLTFHSRRANRSSSLTGDERNVNLKPITKLTGSASWFNN